MARRSLPSLNALRAFEAFGRHGRMTAAAEELCVTHGAVSRQVQALETELGVALIEGPRNRLRLTESGLKLAEALTRAFETIEEGLPVGRRIESALRISVQPTFAMKWLIPRLPEFVAAFPDDPVQIVESNGPFDFRRDDVDLAVRMRRRGELKSDDAEVTPFLDEHEGPFVAAALSDRLRSIDDLAKLPRLWTRTFPEAWSLWAERAGIVLPPAPVERPFDHYFYMVEAAAAGLGVGVGPWAFVQRDVASGRLVAPFGFVGGGIVVALTPKVGAKRGARRFRDWLVEQGRCAPSPVVSP